MIFLLFATTALIFQLCFPRGSLFWVHPLSPQGLTAVTCVQVSRPFWSCVFFVLLVSHVMRQRIRKERLGNKFALPRSASSTSGPGPVSLRTEVWFLGDLMETKEWEGGALCFKGKRFWWLNEAYAQRTRNIVPHCCFLINGQREQAQWTYKWATASTQTKGLFWNYLTIRRY